MGDTVKLTLEIEYMLDKDGWPRITGLTPADTVSAALVEELCGSVEAWRRSFLMNDTMTPPKEDE